MKNVSDCGGNEYIEIQKPIVKPERRPRKRRDGSIKWGDMVFQSEEELFEYLNTIPCDMDSVTGDPDCDDKDFFGIMDDGWNAQIKSAVAASKKQNENVKSEKAVTDPEKRKAIIEAAIKAATGEKKEELDCAGIQPVKLPKNQ